MLPTAHVEFTWAALNLIQRHSNSLTKADFRWVAAAALAPDLLDKPLALTLYRESNAALFWGHNLWFHSAVWLVALVLYAGRGAFSRAAPYLLAFSGHLIADRMWGFRDSLFYPLGGGHWHAWVHVGDAGAMLDAYLGIIAETPLLVAFELVGLALLIWFVIDRGLWGKANLRRFIRSGRACPHRTSCESLAGSESELPNVMRRNQGRLGRPRE